ncbi:MAG: DUF535 family protein, partial [Syntrophobacteraceae bacterium]
MGKAASILTAWIKMLDSLRTRGLQAILLLFSLRTFISVIKVFRLANIKGIKFHRRFMALKYAGVYLARSFDHRRRADCLKNHYCFLNSHMTKEYINDIAKGEIILWEEPSYDIMSISFNIPYYDMEGDLCLTFYVGLEPVYHMSFTIIKGHLLGIDEDNIIFITRVQGVAGTFHMIRRATKALDDIAPMVILFTAIQAISTAYEIKNIAGITAREQIVVGDMQPVERFQNSYDSLWIKMGGIKINDAAFLLPTVPQGAPLNMIKKNHRCRTKYKRQLRLVVYKHVLRTFQQKVHKAG